jgi:hypothetical protein
MNAAVSGFSILVGPRVNRRALCKQRPQLDQFGLYFAAHFFELSNKFGQHDAHNITGSLRQHALLTLKRGFDALVEQRNQLLSACAWQVQRRALRSQSLQLGFYARKPLVNLGKSLSNAKQTGADGAALARLAHPQFA